MKRSLITTALAAATVLGSVVMVQAQSQDGAPQPPRGPQGAADLGGPRHDPSFPFPGGPRAGKMHEVAVFDLAGKLAAAEIYIGVKPDQLAVWRTYTEALLDLVSTDAAPPPPPAGEPSAPPPPPAGEDAKKPEAKAQLPGEALASLILEKSEKAKHLQDALTSLKTSLSPAQLDKLVELDRNLVRRPPPPPHGPNFGPGPSDDDFQPGDNGPKG